MALLRWRGNIKSVRESIEREVYCTLRGRGVGILLQMCLCSGVMVEGGGYGSGGAPDAGDE